MTRPDWFSGETAAHYDADCAAQFAPDMVARTVDLLAELAGDGPVLEFAVGTGRVALPLAERVAVQGLEYSPDMLAQLAAKAPDFPAVQGDMASTRVPGEFSLVYLVYKAKRFSSP